MSLFEELINKYANQLHNLIYFKVVKLDDVFKCAINTNNAKVLYFVLAEFEPNTKEFKTIKNRLLTTKNAEYIYYMTKKYFKNFTLIEIRECAESLINSNRSVYNTEDFITEFAINIPNAPIDILTDAIISLDSGIAVYNFAKKITYNESVKLDQGDLEKLTDAICKTLDAKLIYNFAKDIPGANKIKLSLAMAQTLDQQHIYLFARDFRINVEILTEAFIKTLYMTKNRDYVVTYCLYMNVTFIDDLIKLEDDNDLYKLALYIIDDDLLKKIINYFQNKGHNSLIYRLAFNKEHIRKFLLKYYGDTYKDMIKEIERKESKQREKDLEKKKIKNQNYKLSELSQEGLKQVLYQLIDHCDYGEIKFNMDHFRQFLTYDEGLTNDNELKRDLKKYP